MISFDYWHYLIPVLDRVRKHAGSWLVKSVLTLIILTFIFFFGYQSMTSRSKDAETFVAQIGDEAIPRRKFENLYQTTLTRFRENLKDDAPANMEEMLRKNVLDQMVMREILVLYARRLGITVSEEELANSIRSNKNLFPDGNFDLTAYEGSFLPRYRQQYGEDYEEAVRRDLLVEKAQLLAAAIFGPWQEELAQSLSEIQKSSKNETQPAVETLPSFELLGPWLADFRDKIHVEIFEH